jgi:anti-anti-sigma factor
MNVPSAPDRATPPFTLEKRQEAIIARWQTDAAGEEELKALNRSLAEATRADPKITLVVLELASVSFLESLALGLVLHLSNACKAHGRRFKLAALQPKVRQVLSVTRLDRVLPLADSVELAISG